MNVDKKKVYILAFLAIIIIMLLVINYTKDCGQDSKCFNEHAKKCSKSKAALISDSGEERFEILGTKKDSCVLTIHMLKVPEDTPSETRKFLEGKGMICEVPNKEIQVKGISKMEDMSDYCTGPLKEAILQISVEKMYNLIVKNIGQAEVMGYSTSPI